MPNKAVVEVATGIIEVLDSHTACIRSLFEAMKILNERIAILEAKVLHDPPRPGTVV